MSCWKGLELEVFVRWILGILKFSEIPLQSDQHECLFILLPKLLSEQPAIHRSLQASSESSTEKNAHSFNKFQIWRGILQLKPNDSNLNKTFYKAFNDNDSFKPFTLINPISISKYYVELKFDQADIFKIHHKIL